MKRCQPLLGTYVEIRAEGLAPSLLNAAINDAFAAVQKVHRLMSFHDETSELSVLNREAHLKPIPVHPWTYQVLEWGLELHKATDGLFDCAIAPCLIQQGCLPDWSEWRNRKGSMQDIQLQSENKVYFKNPIALDLGGIAKGFAVDQAIETLRAAGIDQAVVNAGGDLRILGEQPEAVYIRDPKHPTQQIPLGYMANGAVATSASYFISQDEFETESMLVDPRSWASVSGKSSYTVIAETCLVADALTKALAIEGNVHAHYFNRFNAQGIIV